MGWGWDGKFWYNGGSLKNQIFRGGVEKPIYTGRIA